ncbi:MAG: sensor domain-containing diguanylate cyclase [Rhodospirillales bacterium]|nr:sensor domain-containing diguanylate cyclase [Alphaproteobacteria bacterium]MBL6948567.1 sensor domain-containing diguanylate cyclase [Rhodospirillales bacterium]
MANGGTPLAEDKASTFELMVRHDEKLKVFNDTVPAGILVLRVDDGKVIFSNRFFHETLGADGGQVLGESWDKFFVDADERQNLMVEFVEKDEVRNFELRLQRKDGGVIWGLASMSSIPIEDEDLLLFAFIDVTQLKEAEAKIQMLANYDTLTELPSRRLFSDRLKKAMNRAERAETEMAVLFIDLDGFKAVNDTLGHEAGDSVLKEVALRLRDCIRKPDTVARLGGDEFIVIIEHQNTENATIVGERIVKSLSRPIETPDGTANIGASIGIAFFPRDGKQEDELLKAADKAMYKIKKSSKGAVGFV